MRTRHLGHLRSSGTQLQLRGMQGKYSRERFLRDASPTESCERLTVGIAPQYEARRPIITVRPYRV